MEYKEITIKLPIIENKKNADIYSFDWAKENTPEGMYIVNTGIVYFLCYRQSDFSPNCMEIPVDLITNAIAREVQETTLGQVLTILNSIFESIKENNNKTQFLVDEMTHIQVDKVSSELLLALERAKSIGQSGAVSPLEIAKALAVIQQPELIKEIR